MKYLLRYSYYIGIALVFAALISLLTNEIRYELIAPFSLLGYMIRLYDDLFDYDTDTKKKLLDKSAMKMLLIIFSIVYFVVNIIFFRIDGLICLVPLAYVFLENHFEVMKLFFSHRPTQTASTASGSGEKTRSVLAECCGWKGNRV